MPPKFTLQPVLDYRHSRVEGLEIELAELLNLLQQHQDLLDKLQALQVGLLVDLSEKQMGEMDLFAIQHLRSNIQLVEDKIEQVKAALVEMQHKVDAKRTEVILARQGEETLKTLKDKEVKRLKLEQAQIEVRQVDDVYISQAYHKRQAGEAYL